MEIEYEFACPHCWQTITMLLDLSVTRQKYVEDCEVCRRPILIAYQSDGDDVTSFEAHAISLLHEPHIQNRRWKNRWVSVFPKRYRTERPVGRFKPSIRPYP